MGRKKKNKNLEEDDSEDNLEEKKPRINLKGDIKRSITAVVLLAVALLSILGFFNFAGSFGEMLNKIIAYSIGWAKFIFPAFLIVYGIALLFRKETIFYVTKLIGLLAVLLSFIGLMHWFFAMKEKLTIAKVGQGGGYIGYALTYVLEKYLGSAGSFVILLALFFIGFILAFNFSLINLLLKFKKKPKEEQSGKEKTTD